MSGVLGGLVEFRVAVGGGGRSGFRVDGVRRENLLSTNFLYTGGWVLSGVVGLLCWVGGLL